MYHRNKDCPLCCIPHIGMTKWECLRLIRFPTAKDTTSRCRESHRIGILVSYSTDKRLKSECVQSYRNHTHTHTHTHTHKHKHTHLLINKWTMDWTDRSIKKNYNRAINIWKDIQPSQPSGKCKLITWQNHPLWSNQLSLRKWTITSPNRLWGKRSPVRCCWMITD